MEDKQIYFDVNLVRHLQEEIVPGLLNRFNNTKASK